MGASRTAGFAESAAGSEGDGQVPPDLLGLRSNALDVAADPLLIVGAAGDVLDCNAAAFTFLDRHRSAVIAAQAASLRTLRLDGVAVEWYEVVSARAPWSGEALIRLPDGSRRQWSVRLVPVFGDGGEVRAMVEAYRDPAAAGGDDEVVSRYLRALVDDEAAPDDAGETAEHAAAHELQRLALGVAALDRVVRQYERLVPAMRAEDPLTEVMAGLVVETREVAESADVARLLRELPRTVERLRLQLQRLAGARAPGVPAGR